MAKAGSKLRSAARCLHADKTITIIAPPSSRLTLHTSVVLRRRRCRSYRPIPAPFVLPTPHVVALDILHSSSSLRQIRSSSLQSPNISFLRRLFFSQARDPATMSAAKTKAQGIIDDNAVAVFSKSYCPYCKATKELLNSQGAKFYTIELDQVDDGSALQDALQEMTNQRSVPNIFINKKHIGGNSDIQAQKGELKNMLTQAGAL